MKSPGRRQRYTQQTGLSLPPKTVITRWGTWLNTVSYYSNNFDSAKHFLEGLESNSAAIRKAKSLLKEDSLMRDLMLVKTHFSIIGSAIKQLETENLSLAQTVAIVHNIQSKLADSGEAATFALDKLSACLSKNPGWSEMLLINEVLGGKETTSKFNVSQVPLFKYAPVTSVSVERSFGEFRSFFRSNRCNFQEENMRNHFIVLFNFKRLNK